MFLSKAFRTPLCVLALLAACGGSQKDAAARDRALVDDWEAQKAASAKTASAPKVAPATISIPAAAVERKRTGTLSRDEILPVLERGLGAFLQGVGTQPSMKGGKFVGFRLVKFFPNDSRMKTVDLIAGDVVTSINHMPIERPEQAIQAWESLRTAGELRVDYLRDGAAQHLEFIIED